MLIANKYFSYNVPGNVRRFHTSVVKSMSRGTYTYYVCMHYNNRLDMYRIYNTNDDNKRQLCSYDNINERFIHKSNAL